MTNDTAIAVLVRLDTALMVLRSAQAVVAADVNACWTLAQDLDQTVKRLTDWRELLARVNPEATP